MRPVDANWWEIFETIVREGDLRGRRVLDVGCGTGRLAAALAERASARVWGVDATPAMLEQARAHLPPGVGLKQGRAEELPFRAGWFERATMWLVVHLVDRAAAFAEARRVLVPGGRLVVVTFDASQFDRYWLNTIFPSLESIDRARFPTRAALEAELEAAGFRPVRTVRVDQVGTLTREQALERVAVGHISTFDLLPRDELEAGRERAEHELPERVEHSLRWLLAFADR